MDWHAIADEPAESKGNRPTMSSSEYLSCAETAKLLRQALKAGFPGVKFSVRSHTYAGGASIDVGWTDGPTLRDVEDTARMYQGASFDGMTDMKSYHSTIVASGSDLREVHFGADFIFCNREYSEGFLMSLAAHTSPLRDRTGSSCRICVRWYHEGWLIRDVDRAYGCSPECAARAGAQYVPAC